MTDGTLMVALLPELGLPELFNVNLHLGLVGLVEVGGDVGVLETFVANLADCQALVLVVIAEHAVGVDLLNRHVAPLILDPAEVAVAVVPHTDLVLGEVSRQSTAGEEEDSVAEVAAVVGQPHWARLSVGSSVVSIAQLVSLQMYSPAVKMVNMQ